MGIIKNTAKNVASKAGEIIETKGSVILLGVGIAGLLTTTILAVRATPKAVKVVDETNKERQKLAKENLPKEEETKAKRKLYLKTAKDMAVLYGPAVALAATSTYCLIKSHNIEEDKLAAMATAYQISETARREYKAKALEVLGEKKEHDIQDAIARDRIAKDPVDKESEVAKSEVDSLCYDAISGRYFRSNVCKLRQVENILNKRLINEMYISLNELYYELGLDRIKIGDDIGWNSEEMIEFDISTMLNDNDQPTIVVDYMVAPRYDWRKLY